MEFDNGMSWAPHLITAAQIARTGNAPAFYRDVRAHRFVRIAPAIYLPASIERALDTDERFLARVLAESRRGTSPAVFSHLSAAALWRLPLVGQWPPKLETVVEVGARISTRSVRQVHRDGVAVDLATIDGCTATSLARTVVDVARTQRLSTAVAMADFALRSLSRKDSGIFTARVTSEDLYRELGAHNSPRGFRKAELALSLTDGLSGSAGESLSRVGIYVLGLPAPILQHEFCDAEGVMYVDFWWPEFNLIGEFDGLGKYLRAEMTSGKTAAEVVMEEKHREDRLRRLGPSVVRWDWPVAKSLPLLEARLRQAGLA
jgi:hypothetical protein